MNIEDKPWQIADKEHHDNRDQDDAKTLLLLLLALPQLLDGAIDPDVETGDDCKGEDTEEDKSEPAVIERIVEIVEAKISREVVG